MLDAMGVILIVHASRLFLTRSMHGSRNSGGVTG